MSAMVLGTLLLCALPGSVQAAFRLYLSADGDDARDGRRAATAIRTLSRADRLLHRYSPKEEVEILIAPGLYLDQQVRWTYLNGYRISFMPMPDASGRAVFDGRGDGTWFQLRSGSGASKLRFRGLTVTRYWLGIDLVGDRDDPGRWNAGNELDGMHFLRIGNKYPSTGGRYSYAAVRLVNSRSNLIVGNVFEKIENVEARSGYVHAIYAAHHSRWNRIENNAFIDVSGDAIRTRDASNGNRIIGNSFVRAGKYAAYSDWFCTRNCGLFRHECPSVSNVFRDNRVQDGYHGALAATRAFGPDDACGAPGQARIIEVRSP
ncbi:right-handed parallel beta-helix repeat-containing protein [Marilutibacter maris]|nr:right-handed parallel beta-helix repeat-containing protein [Lysobacter maris]